MSPVFATDLNWSLTGTESENLIASTITEGVIASINDDSATTYRGVVSAAAGGGELPIEFEHEIAFSESVNTINKIEVISIATCPTGLGITEFKVYLYYSSQWNLVYTGETGTWTKQTDSQTGTWSNVSKIKLYVKGSANNAPDRPRSINLSNYELRAWGVNYSDIGLRVYDGSSVIKIGVQDLDGHALRVRDGDTTYGIPLLATDSADASSLRIFYGSNVKALPAVD